MNELIAILISISSGIILGMVYFGGLWLTLQRVRTTKQPALLTLASFMGRSALCILGFYLISGIGLRGLALCLAGFVLVKIALIRMLGPGTSTTQAGGSVD